LDTAGSCFSGFGGGFFYKNLLAIEPEIGANHSKIVLMFWHILFWSCNIVSDKRHFSGQTLIIEGLLPYLAIVLFAMFLLYQFPGIALWLPDYLFGPDMSR
jgi:hypothetical protein